MGVVTSIRHPKLGIRAVTLAIGLSRTHDPPRGKGLSIFHTLKAILTPKYQRQEFFALRMCLGFISSYCEAKFYRAVVETINERVGRYMLLAMAFSAGMWSASVGKSYEKPTRSLGLMAVAFLPSSFTMYTTMMACTWSFHPASSDGNGVKRAYRATFAIALGAVVGWPFSAAIGLPFVLEQLFLTGGDIATGVALPQLRARRWTTMLGAVSLSACIAVSTL